MSFVVRVISEAVENLFTSAIEKLSTLEYTLPLSVAERRLATKDAAIPEAAWHSAAHTANTSMNPPSVHMSAVEAFCTAISAACKASAEAYASPYTGSSVET